MGTTRRLLAEVRQAFESHGMDLETYAGLLVKMAKGFREIVAADRAQSIRCDYLDKQGKTKLAFRYRPKMVEIEEDGEKRDVIVVDEKTQMTAMQLIGEILGLKQAGGVNLQVNTAVGAGGGKPALQGAEVRDLGDFVVLLEGTDDKELEDMVGELPGSKRRALLEAIMKKGRERLSAGSQIAPGQLDNDRPEEQKRSG